MTYPPFSDVNGNICDPPLFTDKVSSARATLYHVLDARVVDLLSLRPTQQYGDPPTEMRHLSTYEM